MNILLLGAGGQVGWELQRSLSSLGQLTACDRQTADLENLDGLTTLIEKLSPHIIVNAAAFTAVDAAEKEVDKAQQVNAIAPAHLSQLAKRTGAWLVHYSTDYIFDGKKTSPYTEEDEPSPLNVYGASKLAGERAIVESGCKHLIFRTSWVYAARQANFAKTIIRLANTRDDLSVIADQFGAPTSAELIADVTALVLYRIQHDSVLADSAQGIYHLTSAGETSWYGFARFVLEEAEKLGVPLKVSSERVKPIPTEDYPLPAKRPANSRLNGQKLTATFDLRLPVWQTHVERLLNELYTEEV